MNIIATELFKRNLLNHRFKIIYEKDDLLKFSLQKFPNQTKTAQLLQTLPIDVRIHGSHNNTEIQSICRIRLQQLEEIEQPDFFVLPFHNTLYHQVIFANIPSLVLIDKISSDQRSHLDLINSDIIFWLMPDHCLYECSRISAEGEWFFLSKFGSKRMADGTVWDYSSYVDNWTFILK